MIGLTAPQKRVLDFIAGFAAVHGRVPNYVQIAAVLGYAARSSVFIKVQELIERGRLVSVRGSKVRPGYVLPAEQQLHLVPVFGGDFAEPAGVPTAYRGPYPIRSGITCADFDCDGKLLRRAVVA